MSSTPRIVIVGAGFAGVMSALSAARVIEEQKAQIKITLIAPECSLTLRPRLYEANVSALTTPLDELFSVTGIEYISGKVTAIDVSNQHVAIAHTDGKQSNLSYDRLVLASGSRVFHPAIPGLAEHSFDVDQFESASNLEKHLESLASKPNTEARNTVVVCGAGFTGIEVATSLPSRLASSLGKGVGKVVVVDRSPQVGQTLGDNPRPEIQKALDALDIQTYLGASIVSVDADGLTLADGQRIQSNTVIWTGGVKASHLAEQIPGEKDQFGRLVVERDLRVSSAPHVFATGDVAHAFTDDEDNVCLMSCQHALFLGRFSGNNAASDLLGLPTRPYSQPAYVTCLDLGDYGAVVTSGWDRKVMKTGYMAKTTKRMINTAIIYPPAANKKEALKAADPDFKLPSLDDGMLATAKVNSSSRL